MPCFFYLSALLEFMFIKTKILFNHISNNCKIRDYLFSYFLCFFFLFLYCYNFLVFYLK